MDQTPATAAAHQREQALFVAALERPPAERATFLDGACHGDPALRARLDALLAAHEQPATELAGADASTAKADEGIHDIDEAVGQTLGRYKLLERVGEGGCGVVYVAEQTEPVRRRVALKVIKLGMDTKQVVARFEAERQALAMMDHPNIAKVLDAGTTELGRPFFVMELVRGIKITDYCDQANLTTKDRLDLFIKVCQAIQHAHQKGIIHRDIKPSNILVTLHDGVPVPKVIDFGIAKATEGRLTDATVYTQLHQFIGTPAYMSPEQAEMSGLDIDTRSDIYSLGVLLYELLAGSTPFDPKELMASGIDAMRRTIREKEPQRPSTRLATLGADQLTTTAKRRSADTSKLLHQLKGDLDWIVMKCLEKDRQRRYDTANGLAADLKRHLNNEPVSARPPSTAYRFQKAFRRNKLMFAAATAVAVALVVGLGVSTWQAVVAKRARIAAVQAQTAAQSAQKVAETERERAEQEAASRRVQLYAAEVNLAGETLAEDDLNRARELLARQIPAPGETNDLRGFEWRYLWDQSKSAELTTLGQHDARVHGVRFSPDGTLLASSEINGTVKLWDWRARKLITTLGDPAVQLIDENDWAVKPLAFSPDGGPLAVGVGRDIVLWEVAPPHRRLAVLSGHTNRVNYLVFARGGKILASGADDLQVRVWDVTSAEPREIAALPAGFTVSSLAISHDGKTLAASGSSPSIKRWGLSNPGAPVELPALETRDTFLGWVMAIAFSPTTNLLVSGGSGTSRAIISWSLGEDPKDFLPRKLHTAHGSIGIVNAVAFTPDGKTILSAGSDNNITLWDVSGQEQPIKLMGHLREVFSIDVSPDGRTLASAGDDRTVKLWDISSRWRENPKMSHGAYMHTVAISPDSKFVASVAASSKLILWDAATEKPLAEQPALSEWDGHLDFSPDSRILAATGAQTGTIRLLKVPSFEEITNFRGSCPLFSPPDGRELVYFHDRGIHWRDLKTQEERVWKTEWASVRCLAISPDGRSIAAVNGRSVWTWNADAPEHPVEMEAPVDEQLSNQLVWSVAFSPDGHWLAGACWDGNVSLWNLDNPREKIRPFKALNGAAWAVAFSPDGRTLATGGDDATIKLWNLASRQQTATLRGHTGPVNGLAFSRDGTLLASSSNSGTARLWRAPSLQEIAAAEAKDPPSPGFGGQGKADSKQP